MRTAWSANKEKRVVVYQIRKTKREYDKLNKELQAFALRIGMIKSKANMLKYKIKQLIKKHSQLNAEVIIEDSTEFCWGLSENEIKELRQLLG